MTQLKIGDEVFIAWNQVFPNGLYKITKISKGVAHIDKKGYSFDTGTSYVHAKASATTGRAFLSEEDFLNHKALKKAWDSFRTIVNDAYITPKNLTLEDITSMKAILDKTIA